ncbi:MAG: HypC/HybG/HupF family hydrogenase formation chaperone [Candidatus Contendobacter sp.]|nr:MAG: HypC/HybG/HupF family hydrogenase formation chaperone [Candidatus Contendobacter sp.]
MCIAIPARVVELRETSALVERYGERLEVSLLLLDDPVAPGDYLIVQAQTFAVRKIDPDEAMEAYRLFDEIIETIPSA